jgi:glycosyltransferase involved in cell wall biosynthesis
MDNDPSMPHKALIAAVLPTYNEETNVGDVIQVLLDTKILDEIVLVDDGSTDRTFDVLSQAATRDPRVRLVQHDRNKGKGEAIFSACAATSAPYLLLLDADLKNLTPGHLCALMAPILEHRADMTLGLFVGGHLITDLSHWLAPYLTGQRGLRADILRFISREAAAGYGFEVALTVAARQQGYRKRVVPLKGVWHPQSELRPERGFWKGAVWKLRMYGQILRAWIIATRERRSEAKAFFSDILKS